MEWKGPGAKVPESERASERIDQGANGPGFHWPIRSGEWIGPGAKRLWIEAAERLVAVCNCLIVLAVRSITIHRTVLDCRTICRSNPMLNYAGGTGNRRRRLGPAHCHCGRTTAANWLIDVIDGAQLSSSLNWYGLNTQAHNSICTYRAVENILLKSDG